MKLVALTLASWSLALLATADAHLQLSPKGTDQVEIEAWNPPSESFNLQARSGFETSAPWINVGGPHKMDDSAPLLVSLPPGLDRYFRLNTDAAKSNGTRVFDETRVAKIRLLVASNDYPILTNINGGTDSLLNNDGEYVPADLEFDGEVIRNIGLRRKGNSSATRSVGDYIPFKADFDRYVDGQELDGLSKINLHVASTNSGGSGLEDYLGYGAWRDFGWPAARTGWAEVWLNERYLGLYATVEQVNGSFLKRNFDNAKGNLYKPESPAGTLEWRGAEFSNYTNANFDRGNDTKHTAFLNFVTTINRSPTRQYPAAMDVDGVLTYLAGCVALGAWDNYTTMSHNYYLYEAVPGRMTIIPWDMNDSMAAGTNLWQAQMAGNGGLGNGNTNGFPGGGIPPGGVVTNLPGVPPGGVVTNVPGFPPGGIDTNAPIGSGLGGGPHPLSEALLATNSPYRGRYLQILKAFLTSSGSRAALETRLVSAEGLLTNRLSPTRVAALRTNIATRVESLLRQLGSTNFP